MRTLLAKPFDGTSQTFLFAHFELPAQHLLRFGDIRAAAFWIIDPTRFKKHGRRSLAQLNDGMGKLKHRMFLGIAQIEYFTRRRGLEHGKHKTVYKITHVANAAR